MVTLLCHIDDLPDGGAKGFQVPGIRHKVILVRKGVSVFAYLDACPHYSPGTPMAWKTNAYLDGEGKHIACHSHGALFDIETGKCLAGPCLGKSLQVFKVQVDRSGNVSASEVSGFS